jgi:hypothetical protein
MKRLLTACIVSLAVSSCIVGNNVDAPSGAKYDREEAKQPHFTSEARWGARGGNRWEPVVAADPSSSWVYQMTTNQRPDYLLFRASSDSGTTWKPARHICRHGTRIPFQYDPQLAVASDGTVDAVCLNGFAPGVVFSQSHDRGRTWSSSVRLAGSLRYSDKPTLVVSRSGTDVYVAFNSRYALYVAASHDGGATWLPPVAATSEHRWYYSYGAAAAPNGSIWFAVDGETGPNQTGDGHVELVTSADGGKSWTTIPFAFTHEGEPCRGHDCYPDFYTAQDAIAVDKNGACLFVFAKNGAKQGPNSLYASHSSDGIHWSEPAALNAGGNNTSPATAAGPAAGDFRLVWQDNRNGPFAWNTWYARSADGGATWTKAVRLSDRGYGEPYKRDAGYDFPFGDYLGLSVDSRGSDHVIWGEGAGIYYPGTTWWTHD